MVAAPSARQAQPTRISPDERQRRHEALWIALRNLPKRKGVYGKPNAFTACCPAHNDHNPSLGFELGGKGIVLNDMAGCSPESIVAALGFTMADLFPPSQSAPRRQASAGVTLAQIAAVKKLPADFLRSLGVADAPHPYDATRQAVAIPWSESATHYRVTLDKPADGKDTRFLWSKGAHASQLVYGVYGAWGEANLEAIRQARTCLLIEGDSNLWTALYQDRPALSMAGANLFNDEALAPYLGDVDVIYLPLDTGADGAPDTGGEAVARWASASRYRDRIRYIDLGHGVKDLSELHKALNGDKARFAAEWERITAAAQPWAEWERAQTADASQKLPPTGAANERNERNEGEATASKRGPTIAAQLVALATEHTDLWHSAEGDAYATYPVGEHYETAALNTKPFKSWLQMALYDVKEVQAGGQSLQDAILTLEGFAKYKRPERVIGMRLASDPERDGVIYLDLADKDWRVIEITAQGWRLLSGEQVRDLPVRFRRPKGVLALPVPTRGGSLDTLRRFINVSDDDGWRLLQATMIAMLRPGSRYPVLSITGEQGTAKTTVARMIRALVDPNIADARSAPRDERDLVIAALNSHVIVLDNLSSIPLWLSDALCRLSLGSGFATRTLHTNDEETIIAAARPSILTGIEDIATRSDLVDRAVTLTLDPIPDDQRKTEKHLWADFYAAQPAMLGALLDKVVIALARLPRVKLACMPRMADFAEWGVAAEGGALDGSDSAFLAAYNENRAAANTSALEAQPVATAILALLGADVKGAAPAKWTGTTAELLEALGKQVDERVAKGPRWPQNARALSGALQRAAPNLRRAGVTIDRGERCGQNGAREYTLVFTPRAGPSPTPERPAATPAPDVAEATPAPSQAASATTARLAQSEPSTPAAIPTPSRDDVISIAAAAAWPAVGWGPDPLHPAFNIAASEAAWRTFARGAPPHHLQAAYERLATMGGAQ